MSFLERLPNELGRQIWDYMVLPDDIESYSLTCPYTRDTATDILIEHLRLKRQLASVGNSQSALAGEPRGTHYLEIFQLLELVLVNPSHALYVMNLTIESWHGSFETEREFKARLSGETLRVLKQAARDSNFLHPRVVPRWIYNVRKGDESPLLAILLTVLPNLASLKIHRVGPGHEFFFGFVEDITRPRDSTILSNLTSVELPETFAWGKQGYWGTFRVFFNVPSVRGLKAHTLKDGDEFEKEEIAKFIKNKSDSKVTNLDLQDCAMTGPTLQEVLMRFTSLESFTYSWQDHTHYTDQVFPLALRCALLECSRFGLTRLDLKSNQGNSKSTGLLTQFMVLKYLRIEYPLVRMGLSLAEVIPSSLEEFHLHNESYGRDSNERLGLAEITKEMFSEGLRQLQKSKERYPKLKTMTMKGNQSTEKLRLAIMASNQRPDVSLTVC